MTTTVRYTTINGEVIAEKRNGVRKQYVPDPLGSTVALLDNTQTQTDTFSYWPYGEVNTRTGTTPTPFQFVGTLGYYQSSPGKAYVRARYLDSQKGRWLTKDPIGINSGDINLYRYVGNRPTFFIDPSGLFPSQYCIVFCIAAGPLYGACMDACSTAADAQELQRLWNKISNRKSSCNHPATLQDCFLCPGTGGPYREKCEACCEALYPNDEDPEDAGSLTRKCKEDCINLSETCNAPPPPIKKTPPPVKPAPQKRRHWWHWW